MDDSPLSEAQSRIDAIDTRASLLQAAHQGSWSSTGPARNALVMRYRRAIRGYLGAMLRNDHDADEIAQEVLVKILKGDFAGVTAARGRFRDYLKTAVRNTALTFLRRTQRPGRVALDPQQAGEHEPPDSASEQAWLSDWRRSLLEEARQALQAFQDQRPGNVYATLLRLVGEYPEEDSEQLARRLQGESGQPYRADAVRKQLSRARRKFAEFLLQGVAATVEDPTGDQVEAELIELGLLPSIQPFLPPDWKSHTEPAAPK